MGNGELGSLIARFGADLTDLKKGLQDGKAQLSNFQNAAIDVAGSVKKILAFGGISLGLGKIFSDFAVSFKEVISSESALLKMATRLNTTTEALSALGYVGQKAGMEAQSFNQALERMQKNVSSAALGVEQAANAVDEFGEPAGKGAAALRELGLNAEILNKLPISQKLIEISRAMQENIAPADRGRIALELFGKAGGAMVTALAAGPNAIQGWIDKTQQLGGVITTDMAKTAAEAKTAISDLQTAWGNFALVLTNLVAPAVSTAFKGLTDLVLVARNAQQETNFLTESFDKGAPALKKFSEGFVEAIPNISSFAKALLAIPPFTFIFGPMAGLAKAGEKLRESAGPWGEAAETSYGAAPSPSGLRQPPKREKPSKGGAGADDHLLKALLSMLKAQRDAELEAAQNSLDLLKTTNNKKRAELEKSLAEGLIDGQAYYQRLQELQQEETAAALVMIEKKKQAQQKSYQDSLKELAADEKLSPEAKNLAQQKIAAENRKALAKLDTEAAQAVLEGEVKIANELTRQVKLREQTKRQTEDLNLETAQLLGAVSEQEAKLQKLELDWLRAKKDAIEAGKLTPELEQALELNYRAKAFDDSPLGKKIKDGTQIIFSGIADLTNTIFQGGAKISQALDAFGKKLMQDTFKLFFDDLAKAISQGIRSMANSIAKEAQAGGGDFGGFLSGIARALFGGWGGGGGGGSGSGVPFSNYQNLWSPLGSAHGNVFADGVRLAAFGGGGIFTRPTVFAMANGGLGLAGEAGEEGILPLERIGGNLGVHALFPKPGPTQVTIINNTGANVKGDAEMMDNGDLRITLEREVAGAVMRGGPLQNAIKATFNVGKRF